MSRTRTAVSASLVALALSACGSASSSTAAPAAKSTPAAATTTKAAVKTTKPAPPTTTPAPAPTTAVAVATSAAVTPSAAPTPSTPPSPSAAPTTTTGPSVSPRPHFTTPQAAMTYLAAAWNTNNMANLKHVTQGAARQLLLGMHHEAVNLKLKSCALRKGGNGDYLCTFTHDYPKWIAVKNRLPDGGRAQFIAAPSASVGWYMFAYEGCG